QTCALPISEGRKLRQKVYTGSTLSSTTDYIGDFVFRNGQLDYLLHEEGRVAYESSSFRYEYNIKDHLGNVRQVVRAPETGGFMATMELSASEEEEIQFEQLPESRQGGAEQDRKSVVEGKSGEQGERRSRRRHTRFSRDWSSDVCSSDLGWPMNRPASVMSIISRTIWAMYAR